MVKLKLNHHQVHSEPDENSMVTVSGKCTVTGKTHSIKANINQLQAFIEGIHAQVAFPTMSAGDREFLISSCSPEGWDELFKEDMQLWN